MAPDQRREGRPRKRSCPGLILACDIAASTSAGAVEELSTRTLDKDGDDADWGIRGASPCGSLGCPDSRSCLDVGPLFNTGSTHVPPAAYNTGFVGYWVGWCGLFPVWVLGWRTCLRLFRSGDDTSRAELAGLLFPVVGGAVTQLIPNRRAIDPGVAAVMVASAAVNAPLEELLWRGLFLEMFPDDLVRGAVWPLAGFALWHLAPQVMPSHDVSVLPTATSAAGKGCGS